MSGEHSGVPRETSTPMSRQYLDIINGELAWVDKSPKPTHEMTDAEVRHRYSLPDPSDDPSEKWKDTVRCDLHRLYAWEIHLDTNEHVHGSAYGPWRQGQNLRGLTNTDE